MLCRLATEKFTGNILVIEKRNKNEIVGQADDIPYYFNREVNIPYLNLQPSSIIMRIWSQGKFYESTNLSMSTNYALKIVGKPCSTTIDHISGKKRIFVPQNSNAGGRRSALISLLFENFSEKAEVHFEEELISVKLDARTIYIQDYEIGYGILINTLPMPDFYKISRLVPPCHLDFETNPFYMAIISREPKADYWATYCPDSDVRFNRCAILSDRIFIEAPMFFYLKMLHKSEQRFFEHLGVFELFNSMRIMYKWTFPGRFVALRKEDLLSISEYFRHNNVYMLGRYASWTFKLTEDVWDDTLHIASYV